MIIAQILSVIYQLVPAYDAIRDEIVAAAGDGEISGAEARDLGIAVSDALGDVQIRFRGVDILHSPAQREILGGLARVIAQAIKAAR